MKTIASRQMAARPAALWKMLKREGAVLVTKNGQPEGVLLATNQDSWLEDIQEALFARARRAVRDLRTTAADSGHSRMAASEVDSIIRKARKERKR